MSASGNNPSIELKHIIEALLLAAGSPLSMAQLVSLLEADESYGAEAIGKAVEELRADLLGRGIELVEVSSGLRLQTRQDLAPWISRLWEERPQRYSRALLETLALIAYRQPITRGEIEEVRGVSVRSNIIRTLQEREWVRVVGHRDIPGKPALFGTTRAFLDYFNLKSLDDLPSLAEIRDMESLDPELDFAPLAVDENPQAEQEALTADSTSETSEEAAEGAVQDNRQDHAPE